MTLTNLNGWTRMFLPGCAVALLWVTPAFSQGNPPPPPKPDQPSQSEPKADKPSQPEPKSDKPSQAEKAEKSKAEPSKNEPSKNEPSKKDQAEPSKQPRQDSPSNADRSRENRSTERNQTDRNQTDRNQPDARDNDRSRSNQAAPRTGDRENPGQSRTDRPDRSRQDASRDDSRDARTSRDRSESSSSTSRTSEQRSAKDLGFAFSDESDKGLKISNLTSVASKTDLKQGDVIVSINDHRVSSQRDFVHWLYTGGQDRITVIVLRDGVEKTIYLEPEVILQETVVSSAGGWLGVDLYDRFSRAAVVLKVHPGSPAERAGLRADDLIVAVEGEEIRSPEHLGQVIGGMSPGTEVRVEVERNRQPQMVNATLARKESVSQRTITREQPLPPRR